MHHQACVAFFCTTQKANSGLAMLEQFTPQLSSQKFGKIYELVLHQLHFGGIPVKILLQDLTRKGPLFLHPASLQDLADLIRKILFLHPCKILQDLAGMQDKRNFSCKILQEHFYWEFFKGYCIFCNKMYTVSYYIYVCL